MTAQTKPTRPLGVVTLAIALATVSATGRAEIESIEAFASLGLPPTGARVAVHLIPVVAGVVAILFGMLIAKGRSQGVKWIIYALLGGVVGMLTAQHLELFAGVPGLIEAVNGPLAEAEIVEILLWGLGAICVMMALLVGAVAIFGSPAAAALQVEPMDPDCIEVRAHDRRMFAMSAFGTVMLGLACMALAVARQSLPDMRIGPVMVAFVAALLSVIANFLIWRRCDELQRRAVVNGYATSAIVATLGAFGWAIAQTLGAAPPIDATSAFIALTFVQLIATGWIMFVAFGNAFTMVKPA